MSVHVFCKSCSVSHFQLCYIHLLLFKYFLTLSEKYSSLRSWLCFAGLDLKGKCFYHAYLMWTSMFIFMALCHNG
jgi:hypothetical protein